MTTTAIKLSEFLMEYELTNGWFLYKMEFDGAIAEAQYKKKQDPEAMEKRLKEEIFKFRSMPVHEREFLEKMKNENNAVHKDKGVG